MIGGVIAFTAKGLVEVDGREVGVIVFAVAVVDVGVKGHVASASVETAEELQLATEVLIGTVTHRFVEAAVDDEV